MPVEVVVNGQSVARTEVTADGNIEGVSFDVPIKKSSWVALRIYPVVAHQPGLRHRRRQADPGLEEVGRVVLEVASTSAGRKKEPAIRATEKEAAKKAYDFAREAYKRILSECQGN